MNNHRVSISRIVLEAAPRHCLRAPAVAWVALTLGLCWPASARAGGMNLAFEDEFAGSGLDRTRWATRYIYREGTLDKLNSEQQNYADNNNHVVADGVLSLIARPRADGSGRYHSGMVRSRQTFYHGYFEARVWLPSARGVWPAFWLNSDYDAAGRLRWPPEIDIFEFVLEGRHETPNMIHSGVAVSSNGAQGGAWTYRHPKFDPRWTFFRSDEPLNQDWHVVGMLWKPGTVSMYLDGTRLYTREYRWVYEDGERAGPAHILLNLAVGGNWAGRNGIDEDAFPQALRVDYVRVCQYDPLRSGHDARCAPEALGLSPGELVYKSAQCDLPRTRLLEAKLSERATDAGQSFRMSYLFDALPSPKDVPVTTTLLDAGGRVLTSFSSHPSPGTARWTGRQKITQVVPVPSSAAAGDYRIVVGLGKDDPLPLAAVPSLGVADGRLRFTVGSLRVHRK